MIINDLDLGGAHPFPGPQVGQVMGSAVIEGSRTIVWPRGRTIEKHDVSFWVTAWQGMGGASAGSFTALRYMLRAIEQMAGNPDLQPVYIQWSATAQSGQYNAVDPHDGWYVIDNFQPDYSSFIVSGSVKVKLTVSYVAADVGPANLRMGFAGGGLANPSAFDSHADPMVALPIGSTGNPQAGTARTGGEGSIPLTASSGSPGIIITNPVPFVPPGTIAGLFTGGVRVYDTINTGTNPISTSGGFANASWVEVRSPAHDFVGDCIVTNGLLLLLYTLGSAPSPTVYLWNTSLATPAWQSQGSIQYQDNSSNVGTLRTIDLDRVSREEVRIRLTLNTSAGNWSMLKQKLRRGDYQCYCEFWPLNQSNTNANGLNWTPASTQKVVYSADTSGDVADTGVDAGSMFLSPTFGIAAAFGTTANGPIIGWLYQQAPPTGPQVSTTTIGVGDTSAPTSGSYRLYGFFAIPFVTAPNLQAEAESGTLSGGFASVTDAGTSGGSVAKLLSGVVAGAIDLWGTSWTPTLGLSYQMSIRLRVTSAASATAQMQIGIWDVTSSAFATSTTFAPNAFFTVYSWFNAGGLFTPTTGHSYRFRAISTATTTTDWWLDEAALLPIATGTATHAPGLGFMPNDLWGMFMYDRSTMLVRG